MHVINHAEPDNNDNFAKRAVRVEYRLINGDNFEGLSVRDVYFDKDNNIIGWGYIPLTATTTTPSELVGELVHAMKHLDEMLAATKKPVLDEAALRNQLHQRNRGDL